MKRYECLKLLPPLVTDELIVTNLGGVAIEWHSLGERDGNFYMWHSLGLCSSIALGLALALPHRRVVAFDGDGGLLMNLGSLTTIANQKPANMVLIVFDNECYEAPGGHCTATSGKANLAEIARGAGIKNVFEVTGLEDFAIQVQDAFARHELTVIIAKIEKGTASVPHMSMDALECKYRFVRYVEKSENIEIIKPPGHVTKMRGR